MLLLTIRPKTVADQEKLAQGLRMLMAQTPVLSATLNSATGDIIIGAMSEQQLELSVDRLRREFGVEAHIGRPQIAYKETVTHAAEGDMKHGTQAGGRRQCAHVKLRLYPGERGSGYAFASAIASASFPAASIETVDHGIRESLEHGLIAGHPVDDLRVELCEGSHHDADSSDAALRIAGAMAFRDAANKAGPVVLEPIMHVQIVAPTDDIEVVVSSLRSRRAQIQSHIDREGLQLIDAYVPLSETLGYATDLRLLTRGRASHSIQFARYQVRPNLPEGDDDRTVSVSGPSRPSRS